MIQASILIYIMHQCIGDQDKGDNKYTIRAVKGLIANFKHTQQDESLKTAFNSLRPRQNHRHFPDHIFNCVFLKENVWISIKISLKFVPTGRMKNIPALVQIMAWRRPGDNPLSEPMMVSLLTHICVTRPQWVNAGAENANDPLSATARHSIQC